MENHFCVADNIVWGVDQAHLPTRIYTSVRTDPNNPATFNPDYFRWSISASLYRTYGGVPIALEYDLALHNRFSTFVSNIGAVNGFAAISASSDDALILVPLPNEDGELAIELLSEAIDEADDRDCHSLTANPDGSYTLIVQDQDGLEDLAIALSSKWMIHTDESGAHFGSDEQARGARVRTKGDEFIVSEIDWVYPSSNTPAEVCVMLPSWLVCAYPDLPELEWHREINDQLQARFGSKARSFHYQRGL